MRRLFLTMIAAMFACASNSSAITLLSWNVDNYAAEGERLRGRDRGPFEREAMRRMIADQSPDIIALQEIASLPAARELLGEGFEIAIESRCSDKAERCLSPSGDIYTAIAWRRDLNVSSIEPFDLPQLAIDHTDECGRTRPVRGAVGVTVLPSPRQPAITVLSVHLKAACKDDKIEDGTADDCATQTRQFEILREWIGHIRSSGDRVVVLGDFNRRLLDKRDSQRAALDGAFPGDLLVLPDGERSCWRDLDPNFRELKAQARAKHPEFDNEGRTPWIYHPKHTAVVDHALLTGFADGARIRAQQVPLGPLKQFGEVGDFVIRNCDGSLRTNLAFVASRPSDHCPLRVELGD